MVSTPDLWSGDCPQKRVKVEVKSQFEEESDPEWREIPTAQVELHQTRNGKADLSNNARVVFPTEWGESSENVENNVREYVDPLGEEGPLTLGRVLFKVDNEFGDDEEPEYVLKHLGFIAGAGQQNQLESKCWIYDFATMLESVPFTASYTFDPTVKQVVEDISDTIIEETPIPFTGIVIEAGGREYDYEKTPQAFQDGVESWNDFFNATADIFALIENMGISFDATELQTQTPADAADVLSSFVLNDDPLPVLMGKQFQSNRHTVVDALEWISDVTGASWQFKPNPNGTGVALVISLLPTRNRFVQDSVLSGVQNGTVTTPLVADDTLFDTVHVLENTALEQMNPYNTVEIRGAKTRLESEQTGVAAVDLGQSLGDDVSELFGAGSVMEDVYPYAKVRHKGLYQAAGNTELAKRYDSDVIEPDQAEAEASRKLRKLLNTPDEGSIRLEGQPFVSPYDRIDAFEVCNEFVETQQIPVTYEVHTVTHRQKYGQMYETEVEASIYSGEEVLETVISQMEEI
jgi:hypothetical protein